MRKMFLLFPGNLKYLCPYNFWVDDLDIVGMRSGLYHFFLFYFYGDWF